MSNALGSLFSDIAAAIRSKNGEEGTMKPAEFPGKISAIETGGGVEATEGVLFATGLFTPTETPATVEHGLGVIPDMVAVFCIKKVSADSELISATGFSEAWVNAGYRGNLLAGSFSTDSVHGPITGSSAFGLVQGATSTTFQVGAAAGEASELAIGKTYRWIAISGDAPALDEA